MDYRVLLFFLAWDLWEEFHTVASIDRCSLGKR